MTSSKLSIDRLKDIVIDVGKCFLGGAASVEACPSTKLQVQGGDHAMRCLVSERVDGRSHFESDFLHLAFRGLNDQLVPEFSDVVAKEIKALLDGGDACFLFRE